MGNLFTKKKSTYEEKNRIIGFPYKETEIIHPEKCQKLCNINDHCKAWSFERFNNRCRLYDIYYGTSSNPLYVSGVVQDVPHDYKHNKYLT